MTVVSRTKQQRVVYNGFFCRYLSPPPSRNKRFDTRVFLRRWKPIFLPCPSVFGSVSLFQFSNYPRRSLYRIRRPPFPGLCILFSPLPTVFVRVLLNIPNISRVVCFVFFNLFAVPLVRFYFPQTTTVRRIKNKNEKNAI